MLLNCVAPEELHLFSRSEIPRHLFSIEEEYATEVMQKTLQQVQTLEVVSPTMFSSGLYERLKTQLSEAVSYKACSTKNFFASYEKKFFFILH